MGQNFYFHLSLFLHGAINMSQKQKAEIPHIYSGMRWICQLGGIAACILQYFKILKCVH